ncbi:dopamine beta hydroxylase [Culex quinquefasciatus]|uniref:Dopamine beta hydroxylase n=1 Tax=Culex quinquefasciatus TaxID=7176 RepID=B0WDH7_CULQU|nr:dopamine beta hydroxylase [Culex quinquefasciatus]|eukprot:XP_001846761.1 dopamine beta hydroxylase [Culex quinquefasciatus]
MCVPPQNSLNSSPKNCRGSVCHFPLNLAVDLAAVEVLASPERNGCGICGVPAKARERAGLFLCPSESPRGGTNPVVIASPPELAGMTLEKRLTSYDWANQFESFQYVTRRGSFKPLCWTPNNSMLPEFLWAELFGKCVHWFT